MNKLLPNMTPEWSAPSVGEMVEYPSGRGILRLTADSNGIVIVQESGEYKRVHIRGIRPMRKEEEAEVEEMAAVIMDVPEDRDDKQDSINIARSLYNEGYRKTGDE